MANILHLFWRPDAELDFIRPGEFRLWQETERSSVTRGSAVGDLHPRHLDSQRLAAWLKEIRGFPVGPTQFERQALALPSADGSPLPCPELRDPAGDDSVPNWQSWHVDCYRLTERPIQAINDLHFRLIFQGEAVRAGQDFLFWYWYTQTLRHLLLRDQYLPTVRYRTQGTGKHRYGVYAGWEFAPDDYETLVTEAVPRMPGSAAPGFEAESAVRHCAEVLLRRAAAQVKLTQALQKKLDDTPLAAGCRPARDSLWLTADHLDLGRQWAKWRRRVLGGEAGRSFQLGLQLHEPDASSPDQWPLELRAISRNDPSLQMPLAAYWDMAAHGGEHDDEWVAFTRDFGADFESVLLLALGQAARIYPPLWEALETARPAGTTLALEAAFAFLTETAWVLEDAGYRVIVPAWWTPQGRRRAKLRMRGTPSGKKASAAATKGTLSLDELIQYRYDLTLGGETVSPEEWAQLVDAKTPLVRFRGEWVVLDRVRMAEMLAFWKQQGEAGEMLDLQELLRRTAEETDTYEVDPEDALAAMLAKLRDRSRLEPMDEPPGLKATLREYQKRGVAWMNYLEGLGLNGCLADDMGLGKTMQVIALLLSERADSAPDAPTLLIAPTSVLGNWRKEIERFAPDLKSLVHHGAGRIKDEADFAEQVGTVDVVIVSYALVLRDTKLLNARRWQRLVLDEAQNIKNPEAKQTKAILKLDTDHRLALTGTPVENRLLDLWSIFNFLNPGYLGKQAQFRKGYETLIQRDNDAETSMRLKRLVEPFILRRVKTDPAIIEDLPDKVENKQFCNLTREQASLYEAVVRHVERELEDSEGIQRQGLMLSTLMKLKQICNHPSLLSG